LKAGAQSIKHAFQCNIFFKVFWFNPGRGTKYPDFHGFFKCVCINEFKP